MTRYLSIDLGDRRTGLATGDDITGVVTPLSIIETAAAHERTRAIESAIDDFGADALVVGLPLNVDGTAGPAAAAARSFARELGSRTGLAVHLVDERHTSEDADALMAKSGLTHGGKKKRRDALAAAVILARFLDDGPV